MKKYLFKLINVFIVKILVGLVMLTKVIVAICYLPGQLMERCYQLMNKSYQLRGDMFTEL